MLYTFAVFVLPPSDIVINFKILWQSVCVYVQIEKETEDVAEPKYVIKSPPNFCSKFLLEMEMKKVRKKEEEQWKQEEEERLAIEVRVWQKIHQTI